jgi:two-component system alkaline phosphatase synthesis response regulator PhoP
MGAHAYRGQGRMANRSDSRILVVEDEQDILDLIRYNLEKAGHAVTPATTGEAGLARAREAPPALVVLDLMLPGMDGLAVCRALKRDARTADVPVLMVTARGTEGDIVAGLNIGADDYVVKPFSPAVLVARVGALLRRTAAPEPDAERPLTVHGLTIHPGRHRVEVAGEPVALTATEFRILHFLARRPGWVFTRHQIVDGVMGEGHPVTERSVDVQIAALRKKLGPRGDLIETVRGVGYRVRE